MIPYQDLIPIQFFFHRRISIFYGCGDDQFSLSNRFANKFEADSSFKLCSSLILRRVEGCLISCGSAGYVLLTICILYLMREIAIWGAALQRVKVGV
jgi:hypothetical protein